MPFYPSIAGSTEARIAARCGSSDEGQPIFERHAGMQVSGPRGETLSSGRRRPADATASIPLWLPPGSRACRFARGFSLGRERPTSLTVHDGARGGGAFQDASSGSKAYWLDSGASASASASVDGPLADGRPGQLFYAFQRRVLPGAALGQPGEVTVSVNDLQLGGRAFFDGSAATGGYVVGGLGATLFSPRLTGITLAQAIGVGPSALLR